MASRIDYRSIRNIIPASSSHHLQYNKKLLFRRINPLPHRRVALGSCLYLHGPRYASKCDSFCFCRIIPYRFAICDGINLMPSKMIRYTLPPKWIERVFDTPWRVKATSLCVIKLVSRSYELGGTKDGSKVRFDNVGHWLGVCFVSWILSRRIRVFEFLITILQSFLITASSSWTNFHGQLFR